MFSSSCWGQSSQIDRYKKAVRSPGNGWRFRRHNASYSAFEFIGGTWALETWNDISHLLAAPAVTPIWQGALDE